MNHEEVLSAIGSTRIIPVLTVDNVTDAHPVAMALLDGGLDILEVTLRTPAAIDSISAIASDAPGMVVGAGSVTTAELAAAAIDAGAQFLVSPGFDDGVIRVASAHDTPVIPGIATPTEVMRAIAAGLDVVKLFPAEVLGGVAMIKALAAVWPALRFVPTGGVSAQLATDYLALPEVLAVGGSWMVPAAAVSQGDAAAISAAAQACVAQVAAVL